MAIDTAAIAPIEATTPLKESPYKGPDAMKILNEGKDGKRVPVSLNLRQGAQDLQLAFGRDTAAGSDRLVLLPDARPGMTDDLTKPFIGVADGAQIEIQQKVDNIVTLKGTPDGLVDQNGKIILPGTVLHLGDQRLRVEDYNPDTHEVTFFKEESEKISPKVREEINKILEKKEEEPVVKPPIISDPPPPQPPLEPILQVPNLRLPEDDLSHIDLSNLKDTPKPEDTTATKSPTTGTELDPLRWVHKILGRGDGKRLPEEPKMSLVTEEVTKETPSTPSTNSPDNRPNYIMPPVPDENGVGATLSQMEKFRLNRTEKQIKEQMLMESNARKKQMKKMLAGPLIGGALATATLLSSQESSVPLAPAMPGELPPKPPAVEQVEMLKVGVNQQLDVHNPKPGDSFQGFVKHRLAKGIAELIAETKENPVVDSQKTYLVATLDPDIKQWATSIAAKENQLMQPVDPSDSELQKLVEKFLSYEQGKRIYERMAQLMEHSIVVNNTGNVMTRTESGDFTFNVPEFKSEKSGTLFAEAAQEITALDRLKTGTPAPAVNVV